MLLATLALFAPVADSAVIRDIVVAPGEIIRTTTIGVGEPVVFIPGIFGAAFGYRLITAPLAQRGYQSIVVEPLGYGWSSHPKRADYSFTAQTARVSRALDSLGVSRALVVAQSSGASIAFRLAILRPDLVRGVLSIDGGPSESAATPGMRRAFKLGGRVVKFAMDESKLRHDVRQEIVKNSGDTTWVTDHVIRNYTAGQARDLDGSIDAFHRMSKSTEDASLADSLHFCEVPVRLLVGSVKHPAEITQGQRELLSVRLRDFGIESVPGSGQYIHEEQPAVVIEAVTRLDQAAGR